MLAQTLGLAWLLLAPLSLWLLVRGRNPARLGAVLTLAALETATILATPSGGRAHPAAAQAVPERAHCAPYSPKPTAARLVGRRDLRLTWPASASECDTAKVLLRTSGRKLRVWLHEGPLKKHRKGLLTLPVHVTNGTASLSVPLPRPRDYRPYDGHTDHRIPTAPGTAHRHRAQKS
ncbi:hypothetical protein [Nonomuraea longicatena]|uniref:Integral membrane protein n=1 Tax=Nonomuraea longicatena TaxID=83682 RepID=A0ABP4AXH7_9ACTN